MNIHLIAIGGSVMHQLAIALSFKGNIVTGSDDEIFEPAKSNLEKAGILPPSTGWFPEKITGDLTAVILGMHARENNPELLKARKTGVKIFSFPEYIYEESQHKFRVGVAGSHGKTSTTAMIMHVLRSAAKDFDYLVGAKIPGFEQSVRLTNAPLIICEADEYPASSLEKRPKFHFLFPHLAVITGISWDHVNVFPTLQNYIYQFEIFLDTIAPGGLLVYNDSDETLRSLVQKNTRRDIRYQPYHLPEYIIEEGKTALSIEGNKISLQIFGDHNLLNLHAAFYVCKELGINPEAFVTAVGDFTGASRRLELISTHNNRNVYRDFAHAPSKVKASVSAVKKQFPDKKLIAILELHTYSSLNENFLTEYGGAMDSADTGIVFYSGHALELKRLPLLLHDKIKEGFNKNSLLVFNVKADLENWLENEREAGTNILLMSSGNFEGMDFSRIFSGNSDGK